MSQYVRDQWAVEQGFPGGPVYAIAQTPDGYLWIGTEKGLVRFNGIDFRLFQHSDSKSFPAGPILGLAVDAQGVLWVRVRGSSLFRYSDGVFHDVLPELKLAEADITAMGLGNNGEILFSGLANGTVRYSKGGFLTLASAADLPRLIISLAETADARVWMGTKDVGLYYLSGGELHAVTKGLSDRKINSLLATDSRELWVATDSGVVRWNGTEFSRAGVPRALDHVQCFVIMRDRDSNVWVGSSSGLVRIGPTGVSTSDRGANQSPDPVTALFEDREGNIWIGTTRGIERLRDSVFTTYSVAGGLPSESNGPVYVDWQGRTWFGPTNGGLYWLKGSAVGRVSSFGLDRDVVYSIDGSKDELWIGRQLGGLTHLRYRGASFNAETYTKKEGLAQNTVYAVHENRDGTVWAGTLSAGLSRFKNGRFTTYTTANGLASNTIASIMEASDGTMWFGTPNGVSSLSKGQWRSYTSTEGLPPGNVNCLLGDSAGALWIGTANGLAFIRSGTVESPREGPESLQESIFGIAEGKTGSLWITTANHILRVDREKMMRHVLSRADVREYGLEDGLLSWGGVRRHRSVVADSLGRIWFSMSRGLSFVDPRPMAENSAPALVHVEGISSDGRRVDLERRIRIPAPHQRITLSYTGLSLSIPARVRFRYRLDGFDRDWSEPTSTREATYTNLNSGSYRFRVIASNSDGLWNSSESALQFEIEPLFWQTWWFLLAVVLALALLLLLSIRLRMLQLTARLQMRFEERLAERTRIAQELHDTLLQGFLSASMQLHVADERLSSDSPAKTLVGRVLGLMDQVIEEGRNAVRGLRSPKRGLPDLGQCFSRIREEFPMQSQIGFRVIVEGIPQPLRPLISDEVYLIGHEAVSNAFRHSHASDIEVELEYATSHLLVLIRDNGVGIGPEILRSGREGHWGLSGMKERTERIGGKLRVLSNAGAGTEVELSVPGPVAFESSSSSNGWRRWLTWLQPGSLRRKETRGESEQLK